MQSQLATTPSPSNSNSTWLDLLPVDTCARIASMLPPFKHLHNDKLHYQTIAVLPDALALSKVSAHQRRAVALAQHSVFRIHRVNDASHARLLVRLWRDVLASDIREVHLPDNIGVNYDVCEVLALPSVRKATIPAFPSFMRALIQGASVEALELHVTNTEKVAGETSLDLLIHLLKSCPLEALSLTCLSCGGPAIWYHGNCQSLDALNNLARGWVITTTLTSLHLICESHKVDALRYLPRLFPSLERLCVQVGHLDSVYMSDGPVFSPAVTETLRKLDNLELVECGYADQFSSQFRAALTQFTSWMLHSAERLETLKLCPRLQSLHIMVDEHVLHAFPTNICSLRSLTLEWDGDQYDAQQGYYLPRTEQLIAIIQRNPHLRELGLKTVCIPYLVVEAIMARAGSRMEVLEIPIFMQRECVRERFSKIIGLVMKHAPNMRDLEFDVDTTFSRSSRDRALSRNSDPCINDHHTEDELGEIAEIADIANCQGCKLWNLIDATYRVLQSRMPAIREEGFLALKESLLNRHW